MTHRPRAAPAAATKQRAGRPAREPPPGSPWDDPIDEAPLVFLDLEMTGLDPARDRIVELCAERVRRGEVEDRLETLVRVGADVFGSAHIHGIQLEELAAAPPFEGVADRVLELVRGAVPVAHAADWDVRFLEAELGRAGRAGQIPDFLDTLTLARRAFALPSHSLDALSRSFALPRARAHRAGDDVRALRGLWPRILEVLSPATPRDLWHVRIGERRARPAIVAAALHAAERDLPVRVRYRPAGRGPEDLEMVVTAVRTDLDPPRVLGYLLPSRGRRDLRADRILAIETAGPVPAGPQAAPHLGTAGPQGGPQPGEPRAASGPGTPRGER